MYFIHCPILYVILQLIIGFLTLENICLTQKVAQVYNTLTSQIVY